MSNRSLLAVLFPLYSVGTLGCTVCSSEGGQQVRDRIIGDDFCFSLIATAAPWLTISAIILGWAAVTRAKMAVAVNRGKTQ